MRDHPSGYGTSTFLLKHPQKIHAEANKRRKVVQTPVSSDAQFFPGMFFIGTNGGGEAYAFKVLSTDGAVFEVPFIGLPSDARMIADSFESFVSGARLEPDFVNDHSEDPVAMYMRELSTIEPLTKHEETTLFEKLRGTIGTEQRELIERRLIESQLPLVASIAEKHTASGIPMLDLIQEGNLGLMKSIRSFAEAPTGDFAIFAATCIEDAITKAYPYSRVTGFE